MTDDRPAARSLQEALDWHEEITRQLRELGVPDAIDVLAGREAPEWSAAAALERARSMRTQSLAASDPELREQAMDHDSLARVYAEMAVQVLGTEPSFFEAATWITSMVTGLAMREFSAAQTLHIMNLFVYHLDPQ
ncbi:hypothetical protein [Actinomadura flavalba]|uniref:hypothetical protein n=1 Tax=Actinomadura flavalba TaxID=1120938 RepID=UPI000363964E|nr:hypothetical protein [Actinomadura flavalba]